MIWIHKQTMIKKPCFYTSASILLAVFFCVFGLFNAENASAATTLYCSDRADCSSKIQSAVSGDIIILTTDINNHDSTCIDFGGSANGITFDGDSHLISGDMERVIDLTEDMVNQNFTGVKTGGTDDS